MSRSAFGQEVIKAARARGFPVSELGRINVYSILHIHPKEQAVLLVAGGVHGNEVGGSLGILRWLQRRDAVKVPVAFLPLVNPTGAAVGTWENTNGQDPNRGFYSDREPEVSVEGVAFLNGLEYLIPWEAFLTLHETPDTDGFFQVTFEDNPSKFTTAFLITVVRWFGLEGDFWEYEGKRDTFEEYLYRQGLHRAVCTEVSSRYALKDRVACACDLIDTAMEACFM